MPLTDALIIETSGKGRPYDVTHAEAWWRDFAELPIDDERRVLSFLARRGDPFGQLAPDGKQISTYHWLGLKAVLEQAAAAWDPQPDETGVSRFRPENARTSQQDVPARAFRPTDVDQPARRRLSRPRPGPQRQGARRLHVRRRRRFTARRPRHAPLRLLPFLVHPPLRQRPAMLGLVPRRPIQQKEIAAWLPSARSRPARERPGGKAGGGCRERTASLQDRSQNFATRKEAAAHAARMREIESRGVGDPHRHDLAGYLRGWLAHHRERGDLAPTTLQGYERNIALASQHCGHILLEKLTPRDLDALYAKLLTHGSQPTAPPLARCRGRA